MMHDNDRFETAALSALNDMRQSIEEAFEGFEKQVKTVATLQAYYEQAQEILTSLPERGACEVAGIKLMRGVKSNSHEALKESVRDALLTLGFRSFIESWDWDKGEYK